MNNIQRSAWFSLIVFGVIVLKWYFINYLKCINPYQPKVNIPSLFILFPLQVWATIVSIQVLFWYREVPPDKRPTHLVWMVLPMLLLGIYLFWQIVQSIWMAYGAE